MNTTTVNKGTDPYTLEGQIKEIIVEVTGCSTDGGKSYLWSRHPQSLSVNELAEIDKRIHGLLLDTVLQAMGQKP